MNLCQRMATTCPATASRRDNDMLSGSASESPTATLSVLTVREASGRAGNRPGEGPSKGGSMLRSNRSAANNRPESSRPAQNPMTVSAAPAVPTPALGAPGRRRWLGMIVIGLGVSLIIVDATIVNVMLPRVVGDLRLTTADAEWITSVYSLTFAALLIPFGMAGDVYGRRRMFVLGTVVFVVASLLAAASGTGTALIGARLLQGAGASMILPATLSTVTAVFHGHDRAVAFGIWGSLIAGMA